MNNDRYAPLHGLVAVTAFAATLPLTRLGLAGFAPMPLTFGRLLGAMFAALAVLAFTRAPLPRPRQLAPLATVAAGGVIGFPLLTALALEGRAAWFWYRALAPGVARGKLPSRRRRSLRMISIPPTSAFSAAPAPGLYPCAE